MSAKYSCFQRLKAMPAVSYFSDSDTLTLKVPITTAADDNSCDFCFKILGQIRLDDKC